MIHSKRSEDAQSSSSFVMEGWDQLYLVPYHYINPNILWKRLIFSINQEGAYMNELKNQQTLLWLVLVLSSSLFGYMLAL